MDDEKRLHWALNNLTQQHLGTFKTIVQNNTPKTHSTAITVREPQGTIEQCRTFIDLLMGNQE